MGFYSDTVVPRLVTCACGTKPILKQRGSGLSAAGGVADGQHVLAQPDGRARRKVETARLAARRVVGAQVRVQLVARGVGLPALRARVRTAVAVVTDDATHDVAVVTDATHELARSRRHPCVQFGGGRCARRHRSRRRTQYVRERRHSDGRHHGMSSRPSSRPAKRARGGSSSLGWKARNVTLR